MDLDEPGTANAARVLVTDLGEISKVLPSLKQFLMKIEALKILPN